MKVKTSLTPRLGNRPSTLGPTVFSRENRPASKLVPLRSASRMETRIVHRAAELPADFDALVAGPQHGELTRAALQWFENSGMLGKPVYAIAHEGGRTLGVVPGFYWREGNTIDIFQPPWLRRISSMAQRVLPFYRNLGTIFWGNPIANQLRIPSAEGVDRPALFRALLAATDLVRRQEGARVSIIKGVGDELDKELGPIARQAGFEQGRDLPGTMLDLTPARGSLLGYFDYLDSAEGTISRKKLLERLRKSCFFPRDIAAIVQGREFDRIREQIDTFERADLIVQRAKSEPSSLSAEERELLAHLESPGKSKKSGKTVFEEMRAQRDASVKKAEEAASRWKEQGERTRAGIQAKRLLRSLLPTEMTLEGDKKKAYEQALEAVKAGILLDRKVVSLGFEATADIKRHLTANEEGNRPVLQLFRNMFENAEFRFERFLDLPFYEGAQDILAGDPSGRYRAELLLTYLGSDPITAGLVVYDMVGRSAFAYRGGMDYHLAIDYDGYYLLMIKTIERALANGCERVFFGPTAYAPKAEFGAKAFGLQTYTRFHVGPLSTPVSRWAGWQNRRTTSKFDPSSPTFFGAPKAPHPNPAS